MCDLKHIHITEATKACALSSMQFLFAINTVWIWRTDRCMSLRKDILKKLACCVV
jgi:hypothetical protein